MVIEKVSTSWWKVLLDVSWATALLLLPVTSFPLLSRLAGGTVVSPASLMPYALMALWLIQYLFRGGKIPRESIPFVFFCSIAIIACAQAFFIPLPSFKGQDVIRMEVEALLTLGIGWIFYMVTSAWLSQSSPRLEATLRWINIGGIAMILWLSVQGVYIFLFQGRFPVGLMIFQRWFSVRDMWPTRLSGFAYEPSWLAYQLNLLYLPFWFSATLNRWSAFRIRLGIFSAENILFGLGVLALLLSSRIGLVSFLFVACFLVLYWSFRLAQWIRDRLSSRVRLSSMFWHRLLRASILGSVSTILIGLYVLAAFGSIYGASRIDARWERLFDVKDRLLGQSAVELPPDIQQAMAACPSPLISPLNGNVYHLFDYLQFAERYVYWVTGWRIFTLYPFWGVGLGNAGFFFPSELPAYGWSLPEVLDYLYHAGSLPNIKSFWVRLLAETGMIGFASFLAWYYVMWMSARTLRLSSSPLFRVVGWAGMFALIAFLSEGFSMDSFALPYLWVSLGMVSAASSIERGSS